LLEWRSEIIEYLDKRRNEDFNENWNQLEKWVFKTA
jgi:hypothetical protein